jgi:hypothetical protein
MVGKRSLSVRSCTRGNTRGSSETANSRREHDGKTKRERKHKQKFSSVSFSSSAVAVLTGRSRSRCDASVCSAAGRSSELRGLTDRPRNRKRTCERHHHHQNPRPNCRGTPPAGEHRILTSVRARRRHTTRRDFARLVGHPLVDIDWPEKDVIL